MKRLNLLALITLLVPTLLMAQDEENHVAVATRPISEEATAQIEVEKVKNATTEEEEGPVESAGFFFDRNPPIYFSNSHHWLTAVTILNNNQYTLELEDGSVWKVKSYDGSWRANDPLIITQNTGWFATHKYKIHNKNTKTYTEADLFLGPLELGAYSRFVIAIDHNRREIMLSDNTRWEISRLDYSIFKDWATNDYIIIGTNDIYSFWDSGSDTLLINVNMNTSARAKQF